MHHVQAEFIEGLVDQAAQEPLRSGLREQRLRSVAQAVQVQGQAAGIVVETFAVQRVIGHCGVLVHAGDASGEAQYCLCRLCLPEAAQESQVLQQASLLGQASPRQFGEVGDGLHFQLVGRCSEAPESYTSHESGLVVIIWHA